MNIIKFNKKDWFINYIYFYVFVMPWNFFNGQMGTLSIVLLIWWLLVGKDRGYFIKLKDIVKVKPLLLLIIFFLYAYLSLLWTENIEFAKDS
ncbi:MAG TPA: O-antigen ligase domain-containing protein, partial [Campylobacterales bacterium]|nr:O-antigen ligase domain-containing protein [Campylobacterales bacterium]